MPREIKIDLSKYEAAKKGEVVEEKKTPSVAIDLSKYEALKKKSGQEGSKPASETSTSKLDAVEMLPIEELDITTKRDATDVYNNLIPKIDLEEAHYNKWKEEQVGKKAVLAENAAKLKLPVEILEKSNEVQGQIELYTPLKAKKSGNFITSGAYAFDAGVVGVLEQFDNSIKAVGRFMGFDPPESPFSKMKRELQEGERLSSTGTYVQTVVNAALHMAPEIMAFHAGMPKIGVGRLTAMTGGKVKHLPQFAVGLGVKEFVNTYQETENFFEAAKRGADGFNLGLVYEAIGVPGQKVRDVVHAATANIKLAAGTELAATSLLFGGQSAAEQFINTGEVDMNVVAESIGIGFAMGAKGLYSALAMRTRENAINNFMTADAGMILRAVDSPKSAKELRKEAIRIAQDAATMPEVNKRQALMEVQMLNKMADVKAVAMDAYKNGFESYKKQIDKSPLSESEKTYFNNKVKHTAEYIHAKGKEPAYSIEGKTFKTKEDFVAEVIKIKEEGRDAKDIVVKNDSQTDAVVKDILDGKKAPDVKQKTQEVKVEAKKEKLPDDVEYIDAAIDGKKPIDSKVMESAINKLYERLDKTKDPSDAALIENIIEKFEKHENITEVKIAAVEQGAAVKSVRADREKPERKGITHRDRTVNQELYREGADNYKFVLEQGKDGLFIQSFDKDGVRSSRQKLDASSVKELQIGDIIFDKDGTVIGVKLKDKSGKEFEIRNHEIAIDYALEKKQIELGNVTDAEFSRAFDVVEKTYKDVAVRVKKETAPKVSEGVNKGVSEGVKETKPQSPQKVVEKKVESLQVEFAAKLDAAKTERQKREVLAEELKNVKFEDTDKAADKRKKIAEHFNEKGIELSGADITKIQQEGRRKSIDDVINSADKNPENNRKVIRDFINSEANKDIINELNKTEFKSIISNATSRNATPEATAQAARAIRYAMGKADMRSAKSELDNTASYRTTVKAAQKSKEKKGKIAPEEAATINAFKNGRNKSAEDIVQNIRDIEAAAYKKGKITESDVATILGLEMALKEKEIKELGEPIAKNKAELDGVISRQREIIDGYEGLSQRLMEVRGEGRKKLLEIEAQEKQKRIDDANLVEKLTQKFSMDGGGELIADFRVDAERGNVKDAVAILRDKIIGMESFKELPLNKQKKILNAIKKAESKKDYDVATKILENNIGQMRMRPSDITVGRAGIINSLGLHFESWETLVEFVTRGGGKDGVKRVKEKLVNNVRDSRRKYEELRFGKDGAYTKIGKKKDALKESKSYKRFWWESKPENGIILETVENGKTRIDNSLKELSVGEAVNIYNLMQNPKTKEQLSKGNKYTPESIARLEAHVKNIVEGDAAIKSYADWVVKEFFPWGYEVVNPTYRKLNKSDMPFEMVYTPTSMLEAPSKGEVSMLDMYGSYGAHTRAKNTLRRVNHSEPIKLKENIDVVMERYVENMFYYASFGETVRDINSILTNKDVANSIKRNSGNSAYSVMMEHIGDIANNGATMKRVADQGIIKFKNNLVLATLGLNPKLFVTQMSSAPAAAAAMNTAEYMAQVPMVFTKEGINAMREMKNDAFIKNRMKIGFNRDVAANFEKYTQRLVDGKVTWQDWSMFVTKMGDVGAIITGYAPFYMAKYKKLSKTMPIADAKAAAMREFVETAQKTQQSSYVENLSALQRGSAAGNLLTSYMSSPIQYSQQFRSSTRNIARGRGSVNDVKRMIMFGVTMPVMYELSRTLTTGEPEDKKERKDRVRSAKRAKGIESMQYTDEWEKSIYRGVLSGFMQGTYGDMIGGKDALVSFTTEGKIDFQDPVKTTGVVKKLWRTVNKADVLFDHKASDLEKFDVAFDLIGLIIEARTGAPATNIKDEVIYKAIRLLDEDALKDLDK
jgi:hypothetical protein